MKKYFLHNGTDHEGPFDIEELKTKEITSDTAVWYDGLDDWTTAGCVEELKVLIKTVPIKKATSKAFIITALLIIGGAVFIISNKPKPTPENKVKATAPNPRVVIQSADFSKLGLLKLKATIYTTILNEGAAGKVLVTFHVYQSGHDYKKTKEIFLKAKESQKIDMVFEEGKILGGDVSYKVEAN